MLLEYCLDGCGVRRLLLLAGVNKAFRRGVDRRVLAMIKETTEGVRPRSAHASVDADVLQLTGARRTQCAKNRAVHWMALGCVSYVREAEMQRASIRRPHVRSFVYTMAVCCFGKGWSSNAGAFTSITRALREDSKWNALDGAERDAFCREASLRLAPRLTGWSEEEIRATLALALGRGAGSPQLAGGSQAET